MSLRTSCSFYMMVALLLMAAVGCSSSSSESRDDTMVAPDTAADAKDAADAADLQPEDTRIDTAADTLDTTVQDTAGTDTAVDTSVPDTPDTAVPDTTVQDTAEDGEDAPEDTGTVDTAVPDTGTDTSPGKVDGEPCFGNSECQSGNCRKAPSGGFQCAPTGALCADGAGGGLGADQKICLSDDSYVCKSDGNFEVQDCEQSCGYYPAVDGCQGGECTPCATSCSQGSECDEGATCNASGACVAGAQGVVCTDHPDCPSNNCRLAPDGTKRCAPAGTECADGNGDGLAAGASVCYSGDLYTCQAGGGFAPPQDCLTTCGLYADVDLCTWESCQPCPTDCPDDFQCKPEAHCDAAGQCSQDLAVAQPCERDAMCNSDNCRLAVDGSYLCVAAVGLCAGDSGYPLGAGEGVCHGGDSHICIGEDTFISEDCADDCGHYTSVDNCTDGACEPCASSCSSDAHCDSNAFCDATNQCSEQQPTGIECSDDSECSSNNCRKAPNGLSYCTPQGKVCSDSYGGGLDFNSVTCYGNDLYECTGPDSFTMEDCLRDCTPYAAMDSCEGTYCALCDTTCGMRDECAAGAYCCGGQCYLGALGDPCCNIDEDCQDGNCAQAPDGQYYCTPEGYYCSDGLGGGASTASFICYGGDRYGCQTDGTFKPYPCPADASDGCGYIGTGEGECMCGEARACPRPTNLKTDEFYMQCIGSECLCERTLCEYYGYKDKWKADRCLLDSNGTHCMCGDQPACPGWCSSFPSASYCYQ